MPTLSIPEPFRPVLQRIADMSPEELKAVQDALASLEVRVKPEITSEQAKKISAATGITDFQDIYRTLVSLSITRLRVDAPIEEFVHGISASVRLKKSESRTELEERLKSLFSIDPLMLTARAFDVQHEYEKVLRATRIVTDIRPLFNVLGTEAIGAMIVHNLSIAYLEDGQHKEIVFAMDNADLANLRKVLERAENKSKISEKLIEKAELQYFESK